jgi:hypothetical protein
MFTDSDWDNGAPTPLEPASKARRAAALAGAMAAGLVLGAAIASGWWAPRGVDAGARSGSAAAVALPATPTPVEVMASAPPSGGHAEPTAALERSPPTAAGASIRSGDPAAAARRKEQAWSHWYEKPRECMEDRRGERFVECANHYIRARREFETTYARR